MPTMKIGQVSHNEITKLQQEHFDLNMRIREVLDIISLNVKAKLISRLPGLIDEINAELRANENDISS
jgi:hypothetical protein